jgi:uncharacterized protein YggE
MKNKILLCVGVVVILTMMVLSGCSAAGNDKPINVAVGGQQTGIWVSGEGKVTVVPDLATVTLGVSAQTATIADAQAKAATAMDKVMAALKAQGVADKDIQTQNYNISQMTRYDNNTQQSVITGYSVSNTVTAKLRNIAKAGAIIDAVVTAGGDFTRFNGINFSVEKPEQYYNQARELAMADAKAKADQMAKLAGLSLGQPMYISESTYAPPTPGPVVIRSAAAGSVNAPVTSISAGETNVTLDVQIAYPIK